MNELDSLVNHHEEFRAMRDQIGLLLDDDCMDTVADEVMELISQISTRLMLHLTMEDRHIYPRLLESENQHAREMAQTFKNEVGHLFGEFQKYRLDWNNSLLVLDDPQGFCEDTKSIFAILDRRMNLEDELLYPEIMALNMN